MAQCMVMDQRDWETIIEGVGLDAAVQQWEARPKASKTIDKEWRTVVRNLGRTANTRTEPIDGVDGGGAESDEDSESGSAAESDTEEFAQFPESQDVNDGRADTEDVTPWDREMRVKGQDVGETIRRLGSGCRQHHNRTAVCKRAQKSWVAEQLGSLE